MTNYFQLRKRVRKFLRYLINEEYDLRFHIIEGKISYQITFTINKNENRVMRTIFYIITNSCIDCKIKDLSIFIYLFRENVISYRKMNKFFRIYKCKLINIMIE